MILFKNIGNKHKQDEQFILLYCITVYMIELYSKYKLVNKQKLIYLIEKTHYNIHYHWWEKPNFNRYNRQVSLVCKVVQIKRYTLYK
jgi:hypothetical protein